MSRQNERRRQSLLAAIASIIVLAASIQAFAQTGKEQPKGTLSTDIVGTWKEQRTRSTMTLTFNKDNSFTLKEPKAAPKNGTYKIIDAETIELKPPDHEPVKLKVKVTGDTLELTRENMKPNTFKRVS